MKRQQKNYFIQYTLNTFILQDKYHIQKMDQPDLYVPEEKIFGQTIRQLPIQDLNKNNEQAIIISGYPYDQGTKRNNGRIGGAMASTIFRRYLKEKNIYIHRQVPIYDVGDITPEQLLEDAHEETYLRHKKILSSNASTGSVLVSIGGSNDQSYCNVRALMEAYPEQKIGVINIDSHFDVRPLKESKSHSGSPFRQMLQNPLFQKNGSRFIQFANKGLACSQDHFKYLQSKGGKVYWLEKDIRTLKILPQSKYKTQAGCLFNQILTQLTEKQQIKLIFVSFDVDAISSRFMPGVSAPSVIGGLTSEEAIEIVTISGLCKQVMLLDFSQFNPSVESTISSTMIVEMFYAFCNSYGSRSKVCQEKSK